MQRYAGEIAQDDDRLPAPMLFDGWGYVPLDLTARQLASVKPDPADPTMMTAEPAEPLAR